MPKSYWLIKSEPSVYPFDKLEADGKTSWDGVRNFEARNNLRAMKKGDLAFFYHSNEGKEIVGIAKVVGESRQDPTTEEDWSVVDFAPVKRMKIPVTLKDVKAEKKLAEMGLVRKGRISVTKVTDAEFALVLSMGNTKL